MDSWGRAVDTRNICRTAYWREVEVPEIYHLGLPVPAYPGEVYVWHVETVELEVMRREAFDGRFTTEVSIPDHLRGIIDAMPSYEEWVESTYRDGQAAEEAV